MTQAHLKLPVDEKISEILELLQAHGRLVLIAPPGTGKTTRVPAALLLSPHIGGLGEVAVLEPRRLAAKLSARRVAQEGGYTLGKEVGYKFRGESSGGPQTRLMFYTEGTLLRRLMNDRELRGVSAVVLDEFHERHLQGDLALSYVEHLRRTSRPDLKIIVMSATIDTDAVSTFLGGAPVVRVEGRVHAVEVRHLERDVDRTLDTHVEIGVKEALSAVDEGDVLVFLPGYADIRRAEARLTGLKGFGRLVVAPLHGSLPRGAQDVAVELLPPGTGRKIILATNIAETSLTIPGVTAVVDSGLQRQGSFSFWSGVPLLATRTASRASCVQRAGRAGRVRPGVCIRLFTQADFEGRPMFELPEVRRADLAETLLELRAFGVADPVGFPWFEAPEVTRLAAAGEVLYRLGALTSPELSADLTDEGRRLSRLPTHPRFGRALLEASRLGVGPEVAAIIALLEVGDLRGAAAGKVFDVATVGTEAVLRGLTGMARLQAERLCGLISVPTEAASAAKLASVPISPAEVRSAHQPPLATERVARALLAGFPDRVAMKKTGPNGPELFLSSGGTARGTNQDMLSHETHFVVVDVQETKHLTTQKSTYTVHGAAPIKDDWLLDLDPSPLREKSTLIWDRARRRVFEAQRLLCDQLVLQESLKPAPPSPKTTAFIFHEALGLRTQELEALPFNEQWAVLKQKLTGATKVEALEAALARLQLLKSPALTTKPLIKLVLAMCTDVSCADDLFNVDWTTASYDHYPDTPAHRLRELLPDHIMLPSGRRVQVHYELGNPPWIESRLQDFFGLKQTPHILNGELPLTLHLLAPNKRAVQVTRDLQSFWNRTYAEVRRELLRRYPRHKWPEDPRVYLEDDDDDDEN